MVPEVEGGCVWIGTQAHAKCGKRVIGRGGCMIFRAGDGSARNIADRAARIYAPIKAGLESE
jgi:hypothetical protein